MGKWTKEELTCPECGFVAHNPNGLRGHRQFKHGVLPSMPQLPLMQQDRLVTSSTLEQRLTQLEQELGFAPSELEQRLGIAARPITKSIADHRMQLKEHTEQLKAARRELAEAMNKAAELQTDQIKLAQALGADLCLLLLAIEAHQHIKPGEVTFALPTVLKQRLSKALKQAKEWESVEVIAEIFKKHDAKSNIAVLDQRRKR